VPTTDADRTLEILGDDECRRLLATASIGRLAFTADALPAIQPVSYVVRRRQVLIPARCDSEMVRAAHGAVVAFEVDTYCPGSPGQELRPGWSVTGVGASRVVTEPDQVARWDALRRAARSIRPDHCYIAVRLGLLRGWRMSPVPSPGAAAGARPPNGGPPS
jgi:nitroimidazol reductase NimA-like FMN-containing flavoprotein (pyridoxamine 5'-phosphate oxidase superfamily)